MSIQKQERSEFMRTVPIERLNQVFCLNPENGKLYWKEKICRKINVGDEAGSQRKDGYYSVQVDKINMLVHRVIFAMFYNKWAKEIDHKNGNPSDNRIENLRESTRSQNNYNRATKINTEFGYKGVFKQKTEKTWSVRLTVNKHKKRISGFETIELAKEFLDLWRLEAHKDFANHKGKI